MVYSGRSFPQGPCRYRTSSPGAGRSFQMVVDLVGVRKLDIFLRETIYKGKAILEGGSKAANGWVHIALTARPPSSPIGNWSRDSTKYYLKLSISMIQEIRLSSGRSRTISSIFLTWYLTASTRLRRMSFLSLRIWNPLSRKPS
jgi:hypothetical protein